MNGLHRKMTPAPIGAGVTVYRIDPSYDRDTVQDSVALTTKRQFDYSLTHLSEDVKPDGEDTRINNILSEYHPTPAFLS